MRDNSTKQVTPRPADERAELLRALGEQYAERHRSLENYMLFWFVTFGLLRRLGGDPSSWRGRLAGGLLFMTFMLGLPLIIAAVTGQWALAEIQRWTVVAVTFGMGAGLYRPYHDVVDNMLSLHRVMADESGLRRLIAWDRRWYNVRAMAPVAGAFAVAVLVLLFSIQGPTSIVPVSAGTIVVAAVLLYQVGEMTYGMLLLGPESRILGAHKYELYRLSPIDSVALQRSIRGYNGLALLNSVMTPIFILEFVILLPARPSLIAQIALVLLIMTYVSVGFVVLLPRLAMRRIIQAHKEREMAPLQSRLNALSARLRQLTEDEYEEMKRLKETHDQIRNSSENVLPVGAIGRILGALLLPTASFLAAVVSQVDLSNLLERFLP